MTIYAVFERDAKEGPAVVADRFSWFAAILPPIYAIAYGLWLELAAFVVFVLLLAVVGKIASAEAALWSYVVIAVWLGFEAPRFRAATLERSGWRHSADVVASGRDMAELEGLRAGQ